MAMRPRLAIACAVLAPTWALAACGGRAVHPPPPPSPSPTAATSSPSPTATTGAPTEEPSITPSPTPTIEPDLQLPHGAPTEFGDDLAAADLPLERIAPPGASVGGSWSGSLASPAGPPRTQAVAFAWSRGRDPFAPQTGFEVWHRTGDPRRPWIAVYAFTDRPSSGVLGVRFETGDLTGDRSPDALTFEGTGGSGACGTWRVVSMATASELYARQICDAEMRISDGDLLIREAVFAPGDAHCCPSAYRITTLAWDGSGWRVEDRHEERA